MYSNNPAFFFCLTVQIVQQEHRQNINWIHIFFFIVSEYV